MLNSHQNLGALRLKRGPSKLPWLIIHQDVLVEEAPELLEAWACVSFGRNRVRKFC